MHATRSPRSRPDTAPKSAAAGEANPVRLSVVIPALNEAERLPATLASVRREEGVEFIVADGGSRDATTSVAAAHGARVIRTPPGRGRQMNAGAVESRGVRLLFLHADTRLPPDYLRQVDQVLDREDTAAGAFHLAFDRPGPQLRLIAAGANLRSRLFALPYGDQALFMNRTVFEEVGGFPEKLIMEDYELVRRLRRHGQVRLAPGSVITSARRCMREGPWRIVLKHQAIIIGWRLGVDARRLVRWRRGDGPAPSLAGKPSRIAAPDERQ